MTAEEIAYAISQLRRDMYPMDNQELSNRDWGLAVYALEEGVEPTKEWVEYNYG